MGTLFNEVFIESEGNEAFEGAPHVTGYLLWYLEAFFGVDPDPLKVAGHDVDHFFSCYIAGGVFFECILGRSDN